MGEEEEQPMMKRHEALETVRENGGELAKLPSEFRNDKEIVMEALKTASVLEYASERLQDDREIVVVALSVPHRGESWKKPFQYASARLKNDHELCLLALRFGCCAEANRWTSWYWRSDGNPHNGGCIYDIPPNVMDDRKFALALMKQPKCGMFLRALVNTFKSDKEIVLAALRTSGDKAIRYASRELQQDDVFMRPIVERSGFPIAYASENLKADCELALKVLPKDGTLLQFLSPQLRADRGVVLTAITQRADSIHYASAECRADRRLAGECLQGDGELLRFLSPSLRADRQMVMTAVRQKGGAFMHAARELAADREIALIAIRQNPHMLHFVTDELKSDPVVVGAATQKSANALTLASESLRNNPQIVASANWKNYGTLLHGMGSVLRSKLRSAIEAIHEREELTGQALLITNEGSVVAYAGRWRRSIWEKAWLLSQVVASVNARMVMEYTNFKEEFEQVNAVVLCAPILVAAVEKGIDWRYIFVDEHQEEDCFFDYDEGEEEEDGDY